MPNDSNTLIKLRNINYMVECGIHSGFPSCCIKFFITTKIWMRAKKSNAYMEKIRLRGAELGFHWGYIPCPSCLKKGNAVKVLPCPKGSYCGIIDDDPEDVPLVKETDRPLAFQLKPMIDDVVAGFTAIKEGRVPVSASVGAIVERKLLETNEIIENEIIERSTTRRLAARKLALDTIAIISDNIKSRKELTKTIEQSTKLMKQIKETIWKV